MAELVEEFDMNNTSVFILADGDDGYVRSAIWENLGQGDAARASALRALQGGTHLVYAMRLPDGVIKIGCCKDLANRASQLHGQILGFRAGTFDDERTIHQSLVRHRARGREFYHPHPDVMSVVNELRDEFGLPHLAA